MARFLLTRDLNTHHHLLFSYLIFFHFKQLYYKTKKLPSYYYNIFLHLHMYVQRNFTLTHAKNINFGINCDFVNHQIILFSFYFSQFWHSKEKNILNMSFFFFLQLLFLFVWKCRDRGGVWLMSCRDITL